MKKLGTDLLTCARSMDFRKLLMLGFFVFLGTGCSTLTPDFETPSVGVTTFKPITSDGIVPKFEIGLRVVNPNATQLNLRGMSYKILLNDFEVVEGAVNDLPVVPAYGEAEFKVIATVGLIESIRFVTDLLQKTSGQVAYHLKTKLDVGAMVPAIRIEKSGSFSQ